MSANSQKTLFTSVTYHKETFRSVNTFSVGILGTGLGWRAGNCGWLGTTSQRVQLVQKGSDVRADNIS